MRLTLIRRYNKEKYVIGDLYINGKWFCSTLEDTDRGLNSAMTEEELKELKIKGETAIPIGIYKVFITYSPKYKKNMPLVSNVPGFSGIRIHSGNTHKDTEGCILVGRNTLPGRLTQSRVTYNALMKRLQQKGSNDITLEITRTYPV